MKGFIARLLCLMFTFEAFAQSGNMISNLTSENIDESSATLRWDSIQEPLIYTVTYKVALSNDSVVVNTTNNFIEIDNLVSSSQYLWQVTAVSLNLDTFQSNIASFYTSGYLTDCEDLASLSLFANSGDSITIQWSGSENISNYWEVVCDSMGTNPDNTGRRVICNNQQLSFDNLDLFKFYQFSVRSHCSTNNVGLWKYLYVKNIGGSLHNLPLQIQSSQDTIYKYVGCVSSADGAIDYAYIDFNVSDQASSYYLDFMYKAKDSCLTSNLKVYLCQAATPLSVYTPLSNSYLLTTIDSCLQDFSLWKNVHLELPTNYIGTDVRVVFAWENDSTLLYEFDSMFTNHQIEIKNIYLSARYCPVVDSLWADNITYHSATLHWNMDANQQSYNMQYKKAQDSLWTTIDSIENNYILDNLSENTTYLFRIQSNCPSETSFYSEIDSFKTNIIVLAPSDLQAATTYDSAYLTWSSTSQDNYYIVSYRENSFYAPWIDDTAINPHKTLSSLQPNTQYVFKVRTINFNFDTSIYSSECVFTTKCSPIDEFPYLYQSIIDYNSSSGFVNLPACYDSVDNSLITPVFNIYDLDVAKFSFDLYSNTNVQIYITTDGENYSFLQNIPSNQTSDFVTHDILLTDYVWQSNVRLKFTIISSHQQTSIARISNILLTNACVAPREVNIEDLQSSYAVFSWNAPQNNTSWHTYIYDNQGNQIKHMFVSSNSCTMAQLDSATTYRFVIKSVCENEASIDSTVKVFTTTGHSSSCNAPTGLTAYWYEQTKAEQTVVVSWDNPEDVYLWEAGYKSIYSSSWQNRTISINPTFTIRNLEIGDKYIVRVRAICNPLVDTSDFTYSDTIIIVPSGVETINNKFNTIEIYPNPSSSIFHISINNQDNQTNAKITNAALIDSQGKTVMRWSILPHQLDLSSLSKGIYLLEGYIDNNYFVKKLIKQ